MGPSELGEKILNQIEEKKVRTIIIDGVEIQTNLSAVEIGDLTIRNAELEKIAKEHDILKRFIAKHGLYETLLNDDEFLEWLNKD